MISGVRNALRASLCVAALTAGWSGSASAQSSPAIIVGQTPLSDTDCDHNNNIVGQPQPTTVPPCVVNGTRTVTAGPVTRTPFDATRDRISASFDVQFDGQLAVDGLPIANGPGAAFPFGGTGPRDASVFFSTGDAIVDLQSSYTGLMNIVIPNGSATPTYGNDRAWFTGYTNFNNQLRSINVDQFGYVDADGDPDTDGEYEYQLRSLDPANIVNGNSVDLSGRFGMASELDGIRFGKLSGSATLASGTNFTPYPDGFGATNTGILSPYALQYNVVAELTTQLDENGLITPKIEVKDGVEMNGSRVTGLGDGVAATDAVNKGQLDAVLAVADNPYLEINGAGAPAASATGAEAIAIGGFSRATGNKSLATGSNSRANADFSTAYGSHSVANAAYGTALGSHSFVSGEHGIAIGYTSEAAGASSVAVGGASMALGHASVAVGSGGRATGDFNTALGGAAEANGARSVALGYESLADRANSVSVGRAGAEREITNVAAGTQGTDAVNLNQLNAVRDVANAAANAALLAVGTVQSTADTALANSTTALATANQANGKADQALAAVQQVIVQNGNVVGNNNGGVSAQAMGNGAMAGGSGTVADGAGAIAFGLDNKATGNGAVAIGDPNIATGTGAVAIGADNSATGDGAVALGNLSTANGGSALALGNGATANGAGNIALGGGSSATGANSVALGAGSVASQANTVSVGAAGAERRVTNVAAGTAATDVVNKEQLDAEAAARQQFNLQMSQRQAVQEAATTSLTLGLANEMSARLAADNALSQRIDAVSTRIDQIESQMSVLDDRIASSTAVASALSGNAFLPDMKFNLTANVATYDGAHAGALQMGILVSPNLALNAGVASGLNRRGKTAARAGVTIGF